MYTWTNDEDWYAASDEDDMVRLLVAMYGEDEADEMMPGFRRMDPDAHLTLTHDDGDGTRETHTAGEWASIAMDRGDTPSDRMIGSTYV